MLEHSRYPERVSTEHYFSESPSGPAKQVERTVHMRGREYSVVTQNGVFSHERLDKGTAVLLDKVPAPELEPGDLAVDVGCGWGPITLALGQEAGGAEVWGIDTNERARSLAAQNLNRAGLHGNIYSPDEAAAALGERKISLIWSNPPVRIGKDALHELLATWLERLASGGVAYFVVQKNLGADSLASWLKSQGYECHKIASSKGFRILETTPRSA